MAEMTIEQMVQRWAVINAERERLSIEDTGLKGEMEQLRDRLFKMMDDQGLLNLKLDVGTVFMKASAYPKLLKSKDEIMAWFDTIGHPEIAPRMLQISRVKEYLESALENDTPLPPPDLIEAKPMKQLVFKKPVQKAG